MLISMNWISEFTDLSGIDLKDLINRFTLSTAEVEDIYEKGKDIKNVVVGEILSVKEHPGSKKLHLLKVNTGDEIVDCVCGAPGVMEGMYVPFAKTGGQVGDLAIKEVILAGERSCGMCCSEKEIGVSEDNTGLMVLDKSHAPGTDIREFMELEDVVFEVDNKSLTNRPDLWGHYGIAREIACLTKRPLKPLEVLDTKQFADFPKVPVTVENTEKTYRYSTITASNITRKLSPVGIKIRLTYCGMRPIDLLTDLTNYIMLELGQPMHAFDNAIIKDIRVKTFDKSFEFRTLDEVNRTIDKDTLMICSADGKPAAIAGIMGGQLSCINENTTGLLLESANFDSVSVRKSAVRLGMRTDASARYEKTLDPEMTVPAIERFLKLLTEADKGIQITSSLTDVYVKKYAIVNIDFDKAFVDKYTGISISTDHITETLTALGFIVARDGDNFSVTVPSYRATKDVTIKADIIEEITRIYGYDNIEIKSNKSLLSPVHHNSSREDEYRIKQLLADRFGMNEVHTYIWYDSKSNKELGINTPPNVRIINSVTAENDTIKATLIPSLLNIVNRNAALIPEMGIFEIGRVTEGFKEDGLCRERKKLGIVIASRDMTEKQTFFQIKEIIENITYAIRNCLPAYQNTEISKNCNYIHPVNSAVIRIHERVIGYFSGIHPKVRERIDKKLNLAFAEIDMDDLLELGKETIKYREISKYPGIYIDYSFLVDKEKRYEELQRDISAFRCEYLKSYGVVDVFEDDTLLKGNKSITVRFEFGSDERTLESKEINEMTEVLLSILKEKGIHLR
ncbi:phenylalanine--tRNA ligase subunit beta [Anaerocolumna sedimenticola]|uniref:Phenylalanine--tRNA ligase beta subunit n=1 Tax=Anaerocolumna sedimenticola TaxID=2696063 RepID=A0A6P1TRJ5_9FIRM|nr:phenylalanine--tRNA ligase subunit beta [Anaerocolumna sedimenticola]QHQ62366.1 phenylalanine--tRNA ligase subunit beta [Anaerocolumna sedimenticola]